MKYSINQTFMIEWLDISLAYGIWQSLKGLWEFEGEKILLSNETKTELLGLISKD